MAITQRELVAAAPVEGITLQISSIMYLTGQLTRHPAGFARLDELLMWTIAGLLKAYGGAVRSAVVWPAIPSASASTSVFRKALAELAPTSCNPTL